MAEIKTKRTDVSVDDFLNAIKDEQVRQGCWAIVSRSRGGSNRVSKLVCACRRHNEEKNKLSLEEYGRLRGKDFSHVKARAKAPLKDAAAVNATRWALYNRLKGVGLRQIQSAVSRTHDRFDERVWRTIQSVKNSLMRSTRLSSR
jgi:hypothetical protein